MNRTTRSIAFVVVGLVSGAALGLVGGGWVVHLSVVAKLLIQVLKALATPLVFFATLEAILLHRMARRDFGLLLGIVLTNACLALTIGIALSNVARPGDDLRFLQNRLGEARQLAAPDFAELLRKQIPTSVLSPFVENDILGVVALSLLLGFALRSLRERPEVLADPAKGLLLDRAATLASLGRLASERILGWVIVGIPLVVFSAAASITHQHGLSPFKGLGKYVALCLLAMGIHLTFVYSGWLVFVARQSVSRFFRALLTPALFALGVNSSLVTLPLTLEALDGLGVPRRASTLTTCIGTNLNNDGIILYEGFTLLALAQAFGMDLTLGQQLAAAGTCLVAAMGVAGIPEAGVVALTLVLGNFGLPSEALALLLSVDWIVARGRSVLNVASDMVGATVIARFVEEDLSDASSSA